MTTELTPMQTELLKRSDAIMDSIGKTIGSAVDFSKEQIPDIAYQYIAFERAWSLVALVVGMVTVYVGILLWKKLSNLEDTYSNELSKFVLGVLSVVSCLTGSIIALIETKKLLLVWFAPKVFLLQSLTDLIKG